MCTDTSIQALIFLGLREGSNIETDIYKISIYFYSFIYTEL